MQDAGCDVKLIVIIINVIAPRMAEISLLLLLLLLLLNSNIYARNSSSRITISSGADEGSC